MLSATSDEVDLDIGPGSRGVVAGAYHEHPFLPLGEKIVDVDFGGGRQVYVLIQHLSRVNPTDDTPAPGPLAEKVRVCYLYMCIQRVNIVVHNNDHVGIVCLPTPQTSHVTQLLQKVS